MQNNLQTKLQQKRWRTFAILIVLAICAGVVLAGMKFEPADYRDSLQKAITEAEQLQADCSQNVGNSKGQYSPYTLLEYQQQIDTAKRVLDSSDSQYSHRQTAFETLQQQTKAMKEAANSQVIPKEDLEQLQQSGETGKYTSQWDGGEVEISVSGESISSPSDINIAIGRGPYGDILQASCDAAQLNGMLFSLYHDGDFGAVVTFRFPLPESNRTGALYHYDKQNKKLVLVENSVNMEENVAKIALTQGGDYLLALFPNEQLAPVGSSAPASSEIASSTDSAVSTLLDSNSSPSTNASNIQNNSSSSTSVSSAPTSNNSQPAASSIENAPVATAPPSPTTAPEIPTVTAPPSNSENLITVQLEIRCDTLAQNPSALKDPSKQSYVPSDGTILASTSVQAKPGATVFDVLTETCRNNNIQIEYSYYSGFQSYYIEGINHLYEFDGGQVSGWLYKVNGVFPNYGCSAYTLQDGDSISLLYTCDGGADVGNPWPQ